MRARLRAGVRWGLALVVCLAAAEAAARLDDWVFNDVPLSASPDRAYDLTVWDANGVRGRPHGAFKKWKLNSFGFRGPEIEEHPPAGVNRVMILGASETFGVHESADHEYPALLRAELAKSGRRDVEAVNASTAGTALPLMLRYWESWAHRFRPHRVVIYPSPQFYLDDESPRARPVSRTNPPPPIRSRFVERIVDTARQSDAIQRVRVRVQLANALSAKGDGYEFRGVPADRLAEYEEDLERLGDAVVQAGSVPVLLTHAFKFPVPPEPEDLPELQAYRIFYPRATPEVLAAFDHAAREATLALGRRRGWLVVDAAATLSGRRDLFADPVHFNDRGSAEMARLLAAALDAPPPRPGRP